MDQNDPKTYLWANVVALMRCGDDVSRAAVQRRTKLTPGTVQRLEEGQTNIGVDKLAKMAKAFNAEPWQLLIPGLDPDQMPEIAYPISKNEKSEQAPKGAEKNLNQSDLTAAIATLSQIVASLTPVGRRTVARLLSDLAMNPSDATEVGETIEALIARGKDSVPSGQLIELYGESWDEQKVSSKTHKIEGAVSPVKNVTNRPGGKKEKPG